MIWPGAAVALAFILFFGYRVLPAIYIGTLLAAIINPDFLVTTPLDVINSPHIFLVAAGGTTQAFVTAWILRRLNLLEHDFINPAKISLFYFIAGPLCCLISATIATLTFYFFGMSSFINLLDEWVIWWVADSCSVIIFISLIFAIIKFDKKRKNIIITFASAGLCVALMISFIGQNWENERIDLIFEQKVNAAIDILNQFTSSHIALATNVKGFKRFHPNLTKEDFSLFAGSNLTQYTNVKSLSWIEKVSHTNKVSYEEELKRIHGNDNIELWAMTPDMTAIPPAKAESYTVVKYVEPYDLYKIAIGFVTNADLNRTSAINDAENTGDLVMTAPVILLTAPDAPTAATIYQAHFKDDRLEGFTAFIIQIDSMVQSILGSNSESNFYIELYDKEYGQDLTFRSFDDSKVDINDLATTSVEFPILNRTWVIKFIRTPAFIDGNKTSQPLFIGIAGMLFAAMVTVSIVILSGQRLYLEKLVAQRTEELEKANEAKSEFMANMSHDLRTPLNAIIGFSEIMKQEMYGKIGDKKYREYILDINESSEYLLSLINDILDFSAIDANKRAIEKEHLDPISLVRDCFRSLNPLIENKQLVTEINLNPDFPDIFADQRAMKQVFINLLSNSIKFTPDGGNITVHGQVTRNHILLIVTDTGEGIEEENIEKILDPFTRVENHPHLSQEGTGLGLAIVNALVKLHNGTVSIKSRLHEGTEVTIKIPR